MNKIHLNDRNTLIESYLSDDPDYFLALLPGFSIVPLADQDTPLSSSHQAQSSELWWPSS